MKYPRTPAPAGAGAAGDGQCSGSHSRLPLLSSKAGITALPLLSGQREAALGLLSLTLEPICLSQHESCQRQLQMWPEMTV